MAILTSEDWSLLQTVFDRAVDLPVLERSTYLDEVLHDRPTLRIQVESLLTAVEAGATRLSPAVSGAVLDLAAGLLPSPGDSIGSYRITRLLGRGGMGVVFEAQRADEVYQRTVAIKVTNFALESEQVDQRFERERQILANLDHPNIARLLDAGTTARGLPYFVMEYVDGQPIDAYCRTLGSAPRQVVELLEQVARAVHFAHQSLVLHRDLKPGNVLVTAGGMPKLLDFGIARLIEPEPEEPGQRAETRQLMTPEYASPEQMLGRPMTTASDVYQLGLILHELLLGARFSRRASEAVASSEVQLTQPGSATTIDRGLKRVLAKALHNEPGERYSSAGALADDLRRFLDGFPVLASPPSWMEQAVKLVNRHRWETATASLLVLVIIGLALAMTLFARRAEGEARSAEQVTRFVTELFEGNDPAGRKGETLTARDLLDRGAARLERSGVDNLAMKARLLDTVGKMYDALDEPKRAKQVLDRARSLRERAKPRDELALAGELHVLGGVEMDLGNFTAAKDDFTESLALFRRRLGDRSTQTAAALDDLGLAVSAAGDTAGGERLVRQSLESSLQAGGPKTPESIRAMGNLSAMLKARNALEEAGKLAQEGARNAEAAYGPYHEATLAAWQNLGEVAFALGKFSEAEAAYRKLLFFRKKTVGEGSAHTIAAGARLASILAETGKLSEAQKVGEQALRAAQAAQERYLVAYAQDCLEPSLLMTRHYGQAREMAKAALATRLWFKPPADDETATSWHNLGKVELALGLRHEAAEDFEHAIALRKKVFGSDSVFTAESELELSEVKRQTAQLDEAQKLASGALQVERAGYPAGHPAIGFAESQLGRIYCSANASARATPLLESALAIVARAYAEDHPRRKLIQDELNSCRLPADASTRAF